MDWDFHAAGKLLDRAALYRDAATGPNVSLVMLGTAWVTASRSQSKQVKAKKMCEDED